MGRSRVRKWKLEDYIVVFVATVLVLLLFFFLEGCAAQKAMNAKVLWHSNGEDCVLLIDGMSAQTSKDLSDNLDIENCKIKVNQDKE
jgi:hypothetical protein